MLRKLTLAKAIRNSSFHKQRNPQTSPLSYQFASLLTREQEKAREVIKRSVDQEKQDVEKERFDDFCKKLYEIYEKEEQRKENIKKRDNEFLITALTSKFPVREAMKTYRVYQVGFDDEHLAASLDHLAKLFKIFSNKKIYYSDLTVSFPLISMLKLTFRRQNC